mmetsp:Transcript_12363/g.19496  ORF Transcript_12363/g.19496 Transcript_12363/m.19496 type:complete len:81 (+) Transcript_12363:95-337(+)
MPSSASTSGTAASHSARQPFPPSGFRSRCAAEGQQTGIHETKDPTLKDVCQKRNTDSVLLSQLRIKWAFFCIQEDTERLG